MLPNKTTNVSIEGSLGGTEIDMGFDAKNAVHLMGLLTNLYSDKELACIREYSTNAWDAQVEAGVKTPIEVTTPSDFSPYFKVKDSGVGMSVDDITRIYSQYGSSTKRDSNDFNGMMGIGSKAGLTYTNSFKVVSVKGGVKTTVNVSVRDGGLNKMEVVDTRSTDEPNGTEITIPVKQYNSFGSKSANFFRFWPEGSVLVNGKEPEKVTGTKVGGNIVVSQNINTDYIVMGNVAYPVDRQLYNPDGYYRYFGIIAYVPIGDIDFTPSRESLMDTPTTRATLLRVQDEFKDGITKAIIADIAGAATHADALTNYLAWPEALVKAAGDVTYKGLSIPKTFKGDFWIYEANRARYGLTSQNEIDHKTIQKAVVITGFKNTAVTARHKAKIRAWAEDEFPNASTFVLSEKEVGAPWTDNVDSGTWAEVAATDIDGPKVPGQKRIRAKFDVFSNGYFSETNTFDTTKDVVFMGPREGYDAYSIRQLGSMLDGAVVVQLGKNRWDKFQRDFDGAVHIRTYVKTRAQAFVDALTANDVLSMNASSQDKWLAKNLDLTLIEDKALVDYLALVKKAGVDSATMKRYNSGVAAANVFGISVKAPKHDVPTSPVKNYPLLNGSTYYYSVDKSHAVIYINAAFAANSKESK